MTYRNVDGGSWGTLRTDWGVGSAFIPDEVPSVPWAFVIVTRADCPDIENTIRSAKDSSDYEAHLLATRIVDEDEETLFGPEPGRLFLYVTGFYDGNENSYAESFTEELAQEALPLGWDGDWTGRENLLDRVDARHSTKMEKLRTG